MSSVLDLPVTYQDLKLRMASEPKPQPQSHDSAEEFSVARLVRAYKLLEIEDQELDSRVFDDSLFHFA